MCKKIIMYVVMASLLVSPLLCFAETVEDLRKEVYELKNRIEVLSVEQEDVWDKLLKGVKVTGYADLDYFMTDNPGENNQFRTHKFALILKKKWSDEWNFFTEVEYEYGPEIDATNKTINKGEGKIFNEIFYLEYRPSYMAEFRFGRFLTPAGIWNQEPYAPFVPTDNRPLHIRNIFPQVSDGLQIHGQLNLGPVTSRYNVYAANGAGEPGRTDSNEDKAVGGRVVFHLPVLDDFNLGASAYKGEEKGTGDMRDSYGLDLKLTIKGLKLWGEYANARFTPKSGSGAYDRNGYYGQMMYDIGKFTAIYRYDTYEPSSIAANDKTTVNTVALNYHFTPDIVAKVEHHLFDLENPSSADYSQTIFSMAVYFGE
ncbi:MAG: porin [Deltaproteobacteria bacterium]|nr:porin [Deltaproteobacteria bacterium]